MLNLKRAGYQKCYGIEPDKDMATRAKKLNLNVTCSTIEDIKLPNNFFDVVVMRHVFEHLPDPSSVLAKIYKILNKNGKIFLEIPNIASLEFKLFGKFWYDLDIPRHLYDFSVETIKKMLKKNNFEILQIYHNPVPNNWIGSLRNILIEKNSSLANFFNINNIILICFFAPISFIISLFKKSGRIKIFAVKKI